MNLPALVETPPPRYSRVVAEIDRLRGELDRVTSIEELHEASSRLKAVDAYAKAKGAKDITDHATETRIWIERRAGELLSEDRRTHADLAKEHGVSVTIVARWRLFAAPPRELLEEIIATIRDQRDLSVSGVHAAIMRIEDETGRQGVTRLLDGRFRLRWEHGGVNHYHVCPSGYSLKQATGTLQRLKAKTKTTSTKTLQSAGIPSAYEHVRKALASLDKTLASIPEDAREHAERAMAALYEAEEGIVQARRLAT